MFIIKNLMEIFKIFIDSFELNNNSHSFDINILNRYPYFLGLSKVDSNFSYVVKKKFNMEKIKFNQIQP